MFLSPVPDVVLLFSPGIVCFCVPTAVSLHWVDESWKFRFACGWKDDKGLNLSPVGEFASPALPGAGKMDSSLPSKLCGGWKSQLGCLGLL